MKIQQFDFTVNLLQIILWQYEQATKFIKLINAKQAWYEENQSQFWRDWYANVFNLVTANEFGISVWSHILNVPLYIFFEPESPTKPLWGFNQIDGMLPALINTYLNFEHSNFSTRGTVVSLTLEEQRFLVRLRYFQLVTRGDIPTINEFMFYLCDTSDIDYSGTIYCVDNLDMTMTYTFTTSGFSPDLLHVIQELDIMPRPCGVKLIYVTL